VYQNRVKKTSREKNHDSVQHRFRNPFVKGKQNEEEKGHLNTN